jgi:hypothetical protein
VRDINGEVGDVKGLMRFTLPINPIFLTSHASRSQPRDHTGVLLLGIEDLPFITGNRSENKFDYEDIDHQTLSRRGRNVRGAERPSVSLSSLSRVKRGTGWWWIKE